MKPVDEDAVCEGEVDAALDSYEMKEKRRRENKKIPLSEPYYTLQVKDPQISGCGICPVNENLLVFNGTRNLFLYNVETRSIELLKRLNHHISDMAFSHDGNYFSVFCNRESLLIFQTSCPKPKWQCDDSRLMQAIWHPTENLLFVMFEGFGLCIMLIPDFTCSFLPEIELYFFWISTGGNKILSCLKEAKELQLWDVAEMKLNYLIKRNKVYRLENSESILVCKLGGRQLWMMGRGENEESMKLRRALNSYPSFSAGRSVCSFEYDFESTVIAEEDKNRLIVTASPYVKVLALDDAKLLAEVKVTTGDHGVKQLSIKDDLLAAASSDNISIVSLITFDVQYVLNSVYSVDLMSMHWVDSDNILLVYGYGFVKLFDLVKKEEVKSYHCHRDMIDRFTLFRDKKKFLTFAGDRTIKVFRL